MATFNKQNNIFFFLIFLNDYKSHLSKYIYPVLI